jgi:N-acetylneuraminic acid mutarotase
MLTVNSDPLLSESAPLFARRTMKAVAIGSDIYFFGGIGAGGSESVLDVTDELWKFDTEELLWSRIKHTKPWPSARRWPGWDTDGSVVYFWGGSGLREPEPGESDPNAHITAPEDADVTYDFRNDLWTFDPATATWTKREESDNYRKDENLERGRPRPRYAAVFHRFGEQSFLFGGKTQTRGYENVRFADVWVHEADGSWWELDIGERVLGTSREADWPARRYAAMSAATDDEIYVCGGYGEHDYNDLWRFDLDAEQWELISTHAESDGRHEPRYGSAFTEHDGTLYLFGGRSREYPKRNYNDLWTFDLERHQWDRIQDNYTRHRYDETATQPGYHSKAATAVVDNELYLWGGEGRHGHVSDFWRFNLDSHEWQLIQPQRSDDPIFW